MKFLLVSHAGRFIDYRSTQPVETYILANAQVSILNKFGSYRLKCRNPSPLCFNV